MAHPVRNDGTRHVCHTDNDGGNGVSGRGMNSLGIHRSIRSRKIVLFSVALRLYIVRSIPFDCRFVVYLHPRCPFQKSILSCLFLTTFLHLMARRGCVENEWPFLDVFQSTSLVQELLSSALVVRNSSMVNSDKSENRESSLTHGLSPPVALDIDSSSMLNSHPCEDCDAAVDPSSLTHALLPPAALVIESSSMVNSHPEDEDCDPCSSLAHGLPSILLLLVIEIFSLVYSHPSEHCDPSSLTHGLSPRTVADHQSVSWSSNGSCCCVRLRREVL